MADETELMGAQEEIESILNIDDWCYNDVSGFGSMSIIGATEMPSLGRGRMSRRTVRDKKSGKLIEDLWVDDSTPERLLRRALRAAADIDVVIETKAEVSEWDEAEMRALDTTKYRGVTARLNVLTHDRTWNPGHIQ